jgi:Heparinase II/III-like protein/Heparinase II/III N-terminus
VTRQRLQWYLHRLGRMSPREVGWRLVVHIRQGMWSIRRLKGRTTPSVPPAKMSGWKITPPGDVTGLPPAAIAGVFEVADRLLKGQWEVLGSVRYDMGDPDWSADNSGLSFPREAIAFRIDYRSGNTGNVKQVWELSRHQHLTVLAAAWRLTREDRYADLVGQHLRSWWSANRYLRGVNWASGIELGVRLISWVWIRRLLDGWEGVEELFERNPDAIGHIYWHQRWLKAFPSKGSSGNNHAVAEFAGLLIASCAFAWFEDESDEWREYALDGLVATLETNTFQSGVNRELATEYHGFVTELGLFAMIEAQSSGVSVPMETWDLLCRMIDAAAAILDEARRAPRQGDGDDGRALVVADPAANRWRSILETGTLLFGSLPWWPATLPDLTSTLVSGLIHEQIAVSSRPSRRPMNFPDAGITILRAPAVSHHEDEIWCRCDGGPLGFGALAGHGHADALSVEVRVGGIDVLADPGTYCYHGEPEWRHHFRSTFAHNTLTLCGQNQSDSGGPFMWTRHARTRVLEFANLGVRQRWSAEHDGYLKLDKPARHRRTVTLDTERRILDITDHVETSSPQQTIMTFQLGPTVDVQLVNSLATLRWLTFEGEQREARLYLPASLQWSIRIGELDPIAGWYSQSFGVKVPAPVLLGTGYTDEAGYHTRLLLGLTSEELDA